MANFFDQFDEPPAKSNSVKDRFENGTPQRDYPLTGTGDPALESYLNQSSKAQSGNYFDQFDAPESSKPKSSKEPGIFSDVGNELLAGTGNIYSGGLHAAGMAFDALGWDAAKDQARKWEQETNESVNKFLGNLSSKQKEANAKKFVEQTGPDWTDIAPGPAWKDPRAIIGNAVQSAPSTAASMGIGFGLSKAIAPLVSKALPALSAAATESVTGAIAYGLGEGATSAASDSEQVANQIRSMPEGVLQTSPTYQYYLQDHSPQDAREKVAMDAAKRTFWTTGAVTTLLGAPMGAVFGRMFGKSGPVASSRLKSLLMGGLGEAGQEFAQSGAEQALQNEATRKYANPAQDIKEGVINQAVAGGMSAFPMGAGAGGLSYQSPTQANIEQPSEPSKALPNLGPNPMVVFPDGTTARKGEVDDAIAKLEASGKQEEAAQLRAKLFGYAQQPADQEQQAEPAAQPNFFDAFDNPPPIGKNAPQTQEVLIQGIHKQAVGQDYTQALNERQAQQEAEQAQKMNQGYDQAEAEQRNTQSRLADLIAKNDTEQASEPNALQLAMNKAKVQSQANIQPDDIIRPNGQPFPSRPAVDFHIKAKKLGDYAPVQLAKGQWVARKVQAPQEEVSASPLPPTSNTRLSLLRIPTPKPGIQSSNIEAQPTISEPESTQTIIQKAATNYPTFDKYQSYLRGRLGKDGIAKNQDIINQAWDQRATPANQPSAEAATVSSTQEMPATADQGASNAGEKHVADVGNMIGKQKQANETATILPKITAEKEILETRTPMEVAQPTAVQRTSFETITLNGPKKLKGKLYEMPGYKGPQLAVVEYKSPRGQGYRVYLPKSGVMLTDNNGVGKLNDTLKIAVQRVSYAKSKAQDNKPAASQNAGGAINESAKIGPVKDNHGSGDNLTDSKPLQPDSEEFKQWFSGSKVVDANGKPLIVFHGTNIQFDKFATNPERRVWNDDASPEGLFFTDNKDEAGFYASTAERKNGGNAHIVESYLSIRHPHFVDNDDISSYIRDWLYKLQQNDPEQYDFMASTKAYELPEYQTGLALAIKDAKNSGKDGVIYTSELEDGTKQRFFVVFDPAQVQIANPNQPQRTQGAAAQDPPQSAPKKTYQQLLDEALAGTKPISESDKLRRQADALTKEAMKMIGGVEPGQPIRSTADRNKRDKAMEKMAKSADLLRQADELDAAAQEPTPAAERAHQYPLPGTTSESHERWRLVEQGRAEPDADQRKLMDAVDAARKSGISSYNEAVDHVVENLKGYLPEIAHTGDGSPIKSEVIGAWKALDTQGNKKANDEARTRLNLSVGQKIGNITPNSGKMLRAVYVEEVGSTHYTLVGTAGNKQARISLDPTGLERAIQRAQPDKVEAAQQSTQSPEPEQPAEANKQPWQMTRKEWDAAREKVRPEVVQSDVTKASSSRAVANIKALEHLLYGVTDTASEKLRAAAKGDISLTPDEVEALTDRLERKVSHRDVVEKALAEGKPVPKNVLADYPDLHQNASSTQQTGKIEDFGQKIGGARKDIWQSYKDTLDEAKDIDVAAEPLSKSWPAPNYDSLLEAGADPWAVAFMHAARDEIPAKPSKSWRLKGWVDQVKLLRDFAIGLADGAVSVEHAREEITKRDSLRDIAGRIELYMEVGHSQSLRGVRISYGNYSLHNGIEYDPPKTIWTVEQKAKATAFSNWPRELANGATREEAIANFKAKFSTLEINKPASKDVKFEIYSTIGEPGYQIGKKIGRNPILLTDSFKTIKEAREYLRDHQAELVEKLEKAKEIPNVRRDTNEPRVGEDMRGGKDVTPQMFGEAFGFKGIEFGNWVEQKKRQADLNAAYDALMDMAAVLDIPPKALSLNGELGLAFGARGTGGIDPAKAHYERDFVVINLTKKDGAGSIGHEWWHALDNYFSRMRGKKSDVMTEALDVSLASRGAKFIENTVVRREMIEAFGKVNRAINETALKARSAKLDAKRAKEYWTTAPEMSARAFESYLISKLQDQNASNDYLANIVSEQTWAAAEKMGFELDGSYPYPTAGEVPAIRAAFDHFFNTIETKETETGIALYSKGDNESSGLSKEDATNQLSSIIGSRPAKALLESGRIVFVENEDQMPKGGRFTKAQSRQSTLPSSIENESTLGATTKDGKIYLNLSALDKESFDGVALHEGLHATLKSTIGEAEYTRLINRMANLRKMTQKGTGEVNRFFKEAIKAIPNDTPESNVPEEIAAYAVEKYINAPRTLPETIAKWVKDFIAAIRTGLIRIFPKGAELRSKLIDNLAPEDLAKLAIAGLKQSARGIASINNSSVMQERPLFSKKQQSTDDVITIATGQSKANIEKGYKQYAKKLIDSIDHWTSPISALPQALKFENARNLTQGNIANVDEVGSELGRIFNKASDADSKAIYDYLTTKGATTGNISQPLRNDALKAKSLIIKTGEELVKVGVIPKESFEKYKNAYLPQVYFAYLLGDESIIHTGTGKKISEQGYAKARKYIDKNTDREIRDVFLGEIKDPGYLVARAISIPGRDLALINWLDDIANNPEWILPDQMVDWRVTEDSSPRKVTPFWLKSQAESLRNRAAFYQDDAFKQKAYDMANKMDEQANKVLEKIGVNTESVPDGYKQMPNSPRYGALRGLIVRSRIYDDIVGVAGMVPQDATWVQKALSPGGAGTRLTQLFKWSKVAANPPGQVRNFISNMVMLHLSGMKLALLPKYFTNAIKEIRSQGEYYQMMKKHGMGTSTFASNEFIQIEKQLVELEKQAKNGVGLHTLKFMALTLMDKTGKMYQWSESTAKLMKMMYEMEVNHASEEEAAHLANKWTFDYSEVNPTIRYLRNAPIGVPFITYQVKVLPRLLEVALEHPMRFAPYAALMVALPLMIASQYDVDKDDIDKLKKALPEWLEKRGNTIPWPFKDDLGRWQFADIGYFLPWSQYWGLGQSIGRGDVGEAFNQTGALAGPIPNAIAAITTGKDPFTDRDIIDPRDPPRKQMIALFQYVYGIMAPPWLTGIPIGGVDPTFKGFAGHLYDALTNHVDKYGQPTDTIGQAALRFIGVNSYAVDPQRTRVARLRQMDFDITQIKSRMRHELKNRNLSPEERKDIFKEYSGMIKEKVEDKKKYAQDSIINPKLLQ